MMVSLLKLTTSGQLWSNIIIMHPQIVKWFGGYIWTTLQLWTATLMLPDASRCSQIGWMQSDVLSAAPRQLPQCSSMLWKLWNRIQEYPEECIVVWKMLQNQTLRMCKFRSYWEYWLHLTNYSSAPWTWSHNLWEWLLNSLCHIVQFD